MMKNRFSGLAPFGALPTIAAALVGYFAFGAGSALADPGADPGTGTVKGSTSLTESPLKLMDGMSYRRFAPYLDRVYISPKGASHEIQMITPVASAAELQAYIAGQEAITDHRLIGMMVYLSDREPTKGTTRTITRKIGVRFAEGSRQPEHAQALAADLGLEWLREEVRPSGWTAFQAPSSATILETRAQLAGYPTVEESYVMLGRPLEAKICDETVFLPFIPNDPIWLADNPDLMGYLDPPPDFPDDIAPINGGWTFDLGIRPVWENAAPLSGEPFLRRSYTGRGVNTAVADDGLDHEHEDLTRNVQAGRQVDYVDDDGDPSGGQHGTNVGGIIGAYGGNRIGLVGIAPRTTLAGIRFLDGFVDDELEERVFDFKTSLFDVHNNSWGSPDGGDAFQMGPLAADALKDNAELRDKIFVFANGNGGQQENSNFDSYPGSIYTIAVGSLNFNQINTDYTEPGTNVLVIAPGEDSDGGPVISSTDLGDTYISGGLAGTSFSAPMISGLVALIKQARSDLSWRDIQEILIASANNGGAPNFGIASPLLTDVPLHPELFGLGEFDFGYSWDSAVPLQGIFGYGVPNGARALWIAERWPKLPDGADYRSRTRSVRGNDEIGTAWTHYEFDFSIYDDLRVEHIEVTLEWDEDDIERGALAIVTSPIFEYTDAADSGYYMMLSDTTNAILPPVMTFSSVGAWGHSLNSEEVNEMGGIWRVSVSGAEGRTLESVEITIHGATRNTVPILEGASIAGSNDPTSTTTEDVFGDEDLIVHSIVVRDEDRTDPTISYEWEELHPDGITWLPLAGSAGILTGAECAWDPTANFTIAPISPQAGVDLVQFTSTSDDLNGTVVGWEWAIADGGTTFTSNLPNPTYTFVNPGTANVSLTVTDDSGSTNTWTYDMDVRGFTGDPPSPLPTVPINPGNPVCVLDGQVVLPASLTSNETAYRAVLSVTDGVQQGIGFVTDFVIVNSAPVTLACGGVPYDYDVDLFINNVPPDDFPRFAYINEVSQGILGSTSNGEWVEIMVAVGTDMRGFHLTNNIASFDLEFTQADVWKEVVPGTLITIYNSDFRDSTLPLDSTDATDGSLVVGSANAELFILPDNGDAWGEVSNGQPAHIGLLDLFCIDVDGLSWNGDATYLELPGPPPEEEGDPPPPSLPDGMSAHYSGISIDGYDNPGLWVVDTANPVDSDLTQPYTPGTPGVTPGELNDSANSQVRDEVIALDLTSIPIYEIVTGPAWMAINPATGELSGTPTAADAGVETVTVRRFQSFDSREQTFQLTVKPSPALPPLEDEDGDGVINMLETAFGTDPTVANSPALTLPTVGTVDVAGKDHVSLNFRLPDGAIYDAATQTYSFTDAFGNTYQYEIQCSTDLRIWTNAAATGGLLVHDPLALTPIPGESVSQASFRTTDPLPTSGPEKFLRAVISILP